MEKNEISKALKKILVSKGLGKLRVRGGKGTAWGWIDIWCQAGEHQFTEEEQKKLKDIGIDWGCTNSICMKLHEWEAIVNKALNPTDINLEVIKNKFIQIAQSQPDGGTCCLGSGLKIYKDDKIVDFIDNTWAQSSDSLVVANNTLKEEFEVNGYSTYVEHGNMD